MINLFEMLKLVAFQCNLYGICMMESILCFLKLILPYRSQWRTRNGDHKLKSVVKETLTVCSKVERCYIMKLL